MNQQFTNASKKHNSQLTIKTSETCVHCQKGFMDRSVCLFVPGIVKHRPVAKHFRAVVQQLNVI